MRECEVRIESDTAVSDTDIGGVQGSGGGTYLKLRFGKDWAGLAKRAVFVNAAGQDPVAVVLGVDSLLDDDGGKLLSYGVRIPPEALTFEGNMCYIIEGTEADGTVVYTCREEMRVLPGMSSEFADAAESLDLTPSQAAQLQAQIDGIFIKSIETIVRQGNELVVTYTNGEEDRFPFVDGAGGADGFSPTVEVQTVSGGHTLSVTDVNGTKTFTVSDGAKGDRGAQGEKGEKGDTGAQGEKGDKGDPGAQGEKGDKGDPGAKGEKGDKGDTGKGFEVYGYYDTATALGAAVENPEPGDAYGVGLSAPYDIYMWDGTNGEWKNCGPLQGAKGDKGDTGAQGAKGDKGDPGAKGEKGDKGDTGDPGYSPVKGTDYWTESDKSDIVSQVVACFENVSEVGA